MYARLGYLEDLKTQEIAEKAILNFLIFNNCISGKIELKENQKQLKIIAIYKNVTSKFVKSRNFADFEKLKERTMIGKDGNNEIFVDAEKVLLFVRDGINLNEECFLVADEIS